MKEALQRIWKKEEKQMENGKKRRGEKRTTQNFEH